MKCKRTEKETSTFVCVFSTCAIVNCKLMHVCSMYGGIHIWYRDAGIDFFMDFLFTLLSFLGGLKYWTYYIAGLVWEGRWKIRLSFKAIEKDRKKEEHAKSSRWFFVRFFWTSLRKRVNFWYRFSFLFVEKNYLKKSIWES